MPAPASATDTLVARLLGLCACDSTSGHEDRMRDALVALCAELGAEVLQHTVAPGRTNVLALFGEPRVVLTTHLDTVPPFIAPTLAPGLVRGRGTCDAKGQIVAQLAAIEELLAEGHAGLAWLGVVGEESDAAGAAAAGVWAERLAPCRLLVNGEPTELRLATGQRGYLHLRLSCAGRAAHSGSPELGRSAVTTLLDWIADLRRRPELVDQELGPEVWNLGRIEGGSAVNVVPERATAEILCRTVPGSRFQDDVRAAAPRDGTLEILVDEPTANYPRRRGFEHAPMPFGSDLPALRRLVPGAAVALAGCGSIAVAHTEDEHLNIADLCAGVALNRRLALSVIEDGAR